MFLHLLLLISRFFIFLLIVFFILLHFFVGLIILVRYIDKLFMYFDLFEDIFHVNLTGIGFGFCHNKKVR